MSRRVRAETSLHAAQPTRPFAPRKHTAQGALPLGVALLQPNVVSHHTLVGQASMHRQCMEFTASLRLTPTSAQEGWHAACGVWGSYAAQAEVSLRGDVGVGLRLPRSPTWGTFGS